MKSNTPLLKPLLVAAATMGFCASPTRAEIVDFEGDATSITLSDGDIVVCTETTNTPSTNWAGKTFVISGNTITSATWGTEGYQGSWIAWANQPTFTASLGASGDGNAVKIEGSGFLGITLKDDNGSNAATLDMTNVDASSFTGQISVVNKGVDRITVSLKGDWSGTEYIFGGVTDEWSGTTTASGGYWCLSDISSGTVTQTTTEGPLFSRGWTTDSLNTNVKDDDVLALQGDTTFAGITGVSKDYAIGGLNVSGREYITVSSEGTTLTLAGTGSYEFYGTVGGNYDGSVTRASLIMNSTTSEDAAGSGSQTFGGTNYLQNVTVTAGTLALGGTTDISGTVSVAAGSTLDLSGTITLGSAISNAGTIVIEDGTTFVLDNLTQSYDSTYGYGYCQLIEGSGGTLDYTEGSISFSFDGSTIDWNLYVDGSGNVYAYGAVGTLTWAGESSSNNWNYTDSNWVVEGSTEKTQFIEGDSATFGTIGDNSYGTVNITESLKVGSITVEDDYIFTTSVDDGVVVDTGKALTVAEGKTLTIGEGVTLYIDFVETSFSVDGTINGSGTIELDLDTSYSATIDLGDGSTFTGTVYIHAGDFTLNNSNIGNGTYELAGSVNMQVIANTNITVANDIIIDGATSLHCNTNGGASSLTLTGSLTGNGTLTLAAGSGNALTISGDVDLVGLTIKTSATVTLTTYTDSGVTTGTNQKIGTVTFSSAGTLAIDAGVSLTVGTLTDTATNANITLGDGSTLNVTGSMGFGTGSASSTATKITGQGANKSTVIANELDVGTNNGVSVQVKDVTLVVGSIVSGAGSTATGNNYYLYLADSTLGFTGDTTIQTHSGGSTSRIVLGTKSGSSFATTGDQTTVTISTTKYDTTTNAFSESDGVNVTISEQIEGSDATLIVDGLGKLTLSGTANLGALTVSSGSLELSGKTTVSGEFSVDSGAELDLSGTIDISSTIQNSGTVTLDTSSVIFVLNESLIQDGTTYVFITNTDGGSITNWGSLDYSNFSYNGETLTSGRQLTISDDGTIIFDENGGDPLDLTWNGTGGSNTWNNNVSDNTIWIDNSTTSSAYFADGDSVTFDTISDGSPSSSVVLGSDVRTTTVTIKGSGYELSGNYTLTADSIVLDDEESGTNHTFTIANGTTVKAGTLTESVGQLDLVVNGELNVNSMTVNTSDTSAESISGTGKLIIGSLTLNPSSNSTLTIAVSTAEFENVSIVNSSSNGVSRKIVFGSGTITTDATISGTLALNGAATAEVSSGSTLTVKTISDTSGYSTSLSGEGSVIADEITFAGNQGNTFTISVADLQVGTFTKNAHNSTQGSIVFSGGSATIGEFYVNATGSITFTGEGTYNIGSYTQNSGSSSGTSFAIGDNTTVIMGSYTAAWHENRTFGTNSTLIVTGEFALGTGTDNTEVFSGATVYVGTMNLYNYATVSFSNGKLYIGSGGIISEGANSGWNNCGITFGDGLTVGVYAGNNENKAWSSSANITLSGSVTFNPLAGESIALSGTISGSNGTLIKNGEGTLTLSGSTTLGGLTVSAGTLSVATDGELSLSGTVSLDVAITNSGSISIADDTSIVIGDLAKQTNGEKDAYVLITGTGDNSSSVTFNGDIDSFTLSGGSLDGWSVWGDGLEGGYLVIYGEASTTAETADNLYWAGTEDNSTWSTSTTDTPWSDTESGSSGYYFAEKANVTFGENATNKTVVLGGDITAGTVNITGSGYTLTGSGYTLTATSIVLDDEDSASEHKFTIDTGVKVQAGSLTETAGQLDLVINGELNVTGEITIDSSSNEVISGTGKLTAGTLTYDAVRGSSLTISVTEATFDTLAEKPAGSDDSPGSGNRTLIIGDTSSGHTTTVTAGNMELRGQSIIQVNEGSSFTVTGELVDSSGYSTTISGDGTFIAGSATFSGSGTVTISCANAVIGAIESTASHTLTIASGGELTAGEIYRSGNTLNLEVNGTLNVTQLESYTDSTGMISFGKSGSSTTMAQTISGSGTVNAYGIEAYFGTSNTNHLTISVANLNIGEGGITESTGSRLYINGTTIGLYKATNVTIAANMVIDSAGATFKTNEGEELTLSGAITGNGLVTKTGDGELAFTGTGSSLTNGLTVSGGTVSVATGASLTLGGTVTLASAISNAGTITIADSTSFVLDNLTMGTGGGEDNRDYYVLITGNSGTVTGSVSIENFSLTEGSLEGWTLWDDGLNSGYLVIYGEAEAEVSNLTWAGTENNYTWDTKSENTNWKNNDAPEESVAFTTGSNVTFDSTAENKNVELGENITAGTVKITGSGYTLTATNTAGENEYNLTATELILADEDSGGEHTFTIAEGTKVEVGKLTEEVGQMNLVVNGELTVDGDMHVDASADEVISGSGTFYVRDFTYDAAQGSSLTISVADASFTTLSEQPSSSESDDNSGNYRTLIIGSEGGAILDGNDYSTEVWVGDGLTLAGKSELRVNENSYLYTTYLTDSSDYDTLISGEGYLEAYQVTFGGSGEVTISIATFDVGDITFSNEGKLTISSDCFWAYTATFSNSGEITIAKGANVFIGETTSTESHTITVEENATFTVGSLDQTQNKLDLVVNGTMNVVKDLSFGEYEENTSGLLSFGDSTSDSKTDYDQTLSGTGTVNAYGIETNLGEGSLTISVANLNIGNGGITEYGNNGIHLAGTTIGLYDTDTLELNVPLVIDSAGATFKTNEGEKLTLSGTITGNGMVTKTGDGTLILAGEATLSGLTVSAGTLSVSEGGELALSGEITLATAISNSGTITIADSTSFVIDGIGSVLDLGKEKVYYVVVEGSSGAELTYELTDGSKFTVENGTLEGWGVYTDNGYLVIYRDADMTLVWDGTSENFVWNKETDNTDWKVEDTTNTYFTDGANVIFGAEGANTNVAVSGTVAPGSITINGEYTFNKDSSTDSALVQTSGLVFGNGGKLTIGNDVTVQITETLGSFSANGTIVGTGTLEIALTSGSYGTINLGTENGFAGIVYVTSGGVTLNGSDIGTGTYKLADGVNVQVTASDTEVKGGFILEGTSQVHVNSSDSLTISGSISGVAGDDGTMGGVFDRQGAGSLTISGNVDIGTFIIDTSGNSDVSSSTTFSGSSVNIGTLDVTYADSVVFAGGDESSLNIGTLTFEAAGVIEFQNGGTVGTISYDKQSSSGIIRVSGGTLEVGTITNTYTDVQQGNETLTEIEVGTGAVLHAETITIAPGNAGSVYSTISGITDGGAGTVIADKFTIGASGGGSVEVSDVTLIVGSLSYGIAGNGSNYNLFLNNATLGFTDNTEIKSTTGANDTSRFVLGSFASGNSTTTGSGTTTTINTSKYVVDSDTGTGAFSTEGVTVTISQIISGQGELAVDGVGKLILSAANTYSGGTTIKAGATVVAQNGSALGSGDVTVNGTLQVDTHVTTDGNVTFSTSASLIVSQQIFADAEVDPDTTTAVAVAVITANTISFGDTTLSDSGYLDEELVSDYITVQSGEYLVTGWYYYEGTLYACVIPEPELFSIFFGISALGMMATRRRRRVA